MTRRELLKDEDVIVKFVPHFHRIADPMLDEINLGKDYMIICKKKQTPRSKVRTCGGHVKIICNKNLKTDPLRYPIVLKCSKCDVRPFKFHKDTLNPYERMTHALITDPVTSKPNQTTFSRDNLRHILASLTTGMGYNGYSKYMAALGLDFISERAYYDHCNHIYEIQKQVFKEYQIKVIKLLHTIHHIYSYYAS